MVFSGAFEASYGSIASSPFYRDSHEHSPTPPSCQAQLVRWNPLTGKVDGVDGVGARNSRDNSNGQKPAAVGIENNSKRSPNEEQKETEEIKGSGPSGTGGDETDEGEDDLEGALEQFEWYRRLFDFSGDIPPPESAGYGADEDPDQNLVPQVQRLRHLRGSRSG